MTSGERAAYVRGVLDSCKACKVPDETIVDACVKLRIAPEEILATRVEGDARPNPGENHEG